MSSAVPHIEITNYAYSLGIGCPDSKVDALNSVDLHDMGAELFIYFVMYSSDKSVFILRIKLRLENIRIVYFRNHIIIICYNKLIIFYLFIMYKYRVITALIGRFHR